MGTGFADHSATPPRKQLDTLLIDEPELKLKRAGVRWVKPNLVAEIACRGWTTDQKLRDPSFKGLRDEEDDSQVLRLDGDA